MATYAEITNNAKLKAEECLESVRTALKGKDLESYSAEMTKLEGRVKTLNEAICNEEYRRLATEPHPVIAAVKKFYIDLYKIEVNKDKDIGSIMGVNLVTKKSRIDLKKFCEVNELDTAWVQSSKQLLALLVLRETDVYSIKPTELANQSFYFISAVRKKQNGETPDSNTKIVALLQEIIDKAIFVDNGKGQNAYKCNNHDIAFIQDAVTKMDTKEKCTIAMLNERQFQTVMMSVFAHCLGESYTVKAAKIKE